MTGSTMRRRRSRAFTLAEVLVVIALIGVAAGLAAAAMAPATAAATDEEVLAAAVAAAREAAADRRVTLAYDADRRALVLRDTRELAVHPIAAVVTLSLPEAEVRGAPAALTFSPAGDATPARIRLTREGRTRTFRLEPFSAALAAEPP